MCPVGVLEGLGKRKKGGGKGTASGQELANSDTHKINESEKAQKKRRRGEKKITPKLVGLPDRRLNVPGGGGGGGVKKKKGGGGKKKGGEGGEAEH